MKAVLLAGGRGTRLKPLTSVINKHLLPIYNKPMIYYPLSMIISLGVKDILLTTHAKEMPLFQDLLGDGSKFGINISYALQEDAGGIAEVLKIAKPFLSGSDRFILALGDNMYHIPNIRSIFDDIITQGAGIVLCPVKDVQRFGCAEVKEGKIISLEEKPKVPKSNLAATGFYFYDQKALEFVDEIAPSARGELEITDINQKYLDNGELSFVELDANSTWFDSGTINVLLESATFIKNCELQNETVVGSPEIESYKSGFLSKGELIELVGSMKKSQYKDVLNHYIEYESY